MNLIEGFGLINVFVVFYSKEQWTVSNEERVVSAEQWVVSSEQQHLD